MNEVYLRGKLVALHEPEAADNQQRHLVMQLRISHRTIHQQVKFENYTVNAWRNLAFWAAANLKAGMDVFVRGHLTQRQTSSGALTEVTALSILPLAGSAAAVNPIRTERTEAACRASAPAAPGIIRSQALPQ
ncbi:MAG: single-stranded DNA-binding protein [Clostridia bacterium]|nr:single-stranded DNA-binding protein [Clostridia bacterium]